MNAKEYRKATARTWNTDEDEVDQLVNAALGLTGELGEYVAERQREELGDVLYYIATLERLTGVDVHWAPYGDDLKPPRIALRMVTSAAGVGEAAKKGRFHDDPRPHRLAIYLVVLARLIATEVEQRGWDLDEIRAANIAKLRERYPEGFEKGGGRRGEVCAECGETYTDAEHNGDLCDPCSKRDLAGIEDCITGGQ